MRKRTSDFLEALPPEIEEVLNWFRQSAKSLPVSKTTEEFSGGFLYRLLNDGALFPLSRQAAKLLGFVLTHHEKDPQNPIAWLNLGFAYRLMAAYRVSDSSKINNQRLELALESFDRSLEIESHNARAWIGRGLVYTQKTDHEQAAQCFRHALDIDPTGPVAWLLYSNALDSGGRTEEALAAVDSAFEYYSRLDKEAASKIPEEYRVLLDEYSKTRPDFDARK